MLKRILMILVLIELAMCSSTSNTSTGSRSVADNEGYTPGGNVQAAWKQGCPKEQKASKGPTDGRFTIGIGNKRLMYGYPSPRSTSFFVFKVGQKLASNNASFCEATYISGTEEIDYYSGISIVKFSFLDFEIEQYLIPTDDKLEHVTTEISPKYYRVEYNIINKSKTNQPVSLAVLIDTMIDDNDGPKVAVYTKAKNDFTLMPEEVSFSGENIPKGILLYQSGTDNTKLTGNVILKEEGNSPDEWLIGSWPYFNSLAWGIVTRDERYLDGAILMRWNDKVLNVDQSSNFFFHYGISNQSKEGLDVLLNDNNITEKASQVSNYEKNAIALTDEQKQSIDDSFQAIKGLKITGVTIEGYADAKGDDKINEIISQKRAAVVKDYIMKKHNISKELIIVKPMSSSAARKKEEDLLNGNPNDRKVIMSIATKEKSADQDKSTVITKKNFKSNAEKAQSCTFIYKNSQRKIGKLIKMKSNTVTANIDNKIVEINKKELKTISFSLK
ncbi:MAG: OmpA family protein [Leptospiraceae bacterium]|nr:OmpA family protein [Leptospiraceae bacterium]